LENICEGGAKEAARGSRACEGIREDGDERRDDLIGIADGDGQGTECVENAHQRHDAGGNDGDAPDAADDDGAEQH
jgi:hypothetical protein